MKLFRFLLITSLLATCALTSHAQHTRYYTKALTLRRDRDILTAVDASGKHLVNVDLTKPELKGKVIAFAYSSKKKEVEAGNEPTTSMTLFPNPASQQVQLDLKGNWKYPVDVQIFDHGGNSMQTHRLESSGHMLHIASLRQGIYILKATSGETKAVQKLVVE